MKIGDRVALLPHLDLWARGARYGDVTSLSTIVTRDPGSNQVVQKTYIHVKVDGVPRIRRFFAKDLEVIL